MRILLVVFVCLCVGCTDEVDKITIKGNIIGEIPEKLYYTSPINGMCNSEFVESLTPDSLGTFIINLQASKPLFIQFVNGNLSPIVVEPGMEYELEINLDSNDNDRITVKNSSEFLDYYHSLSMVHPRFCRYYSDENAENYSQTQIIIMNDLEKELNGLKLLYEKNKISKEIYDLIVIERQVYYFTLLSHLASRVNMTRLQAGGETPEEIFKMWELAINGVDFSNPLTLQTIYLYDLLHFKLWYHIYRKYDYNQIKEMRKEHRNNGLLHTNTIYFAKEFLPVKYHEYYIASYISLHSRQRRNQKEKEFIDIVNQYNIDYPESNYLQFFQSNVNKIEEFINKNN